MHYEDALIGAFVKRNKRDRYREIVSNPQHRHKFTKRLAHFSDFDPKYRLPIPSDKLFVDSVARELQKRHCPGIVYVISEDPRLDQTELPLIHALQQIVGRGMGAVVCCIPHRLVFVETEDERFILERNYPLERREYVRFVIGRKDEDSQVEQGIFQAAALALEWRDITGSDADTLTNSGHGSVKTWKGRRPSDGTAFDSASVGLRRWPPSTSLASGRWSVSSNVMGSTLRKLEQTNPDT